MSKSPANHESAPEFAPLRMSSVVDVGVCLPFAPLSYPTHFLDGGDVSAEFYEWIRQLGKGTILIEGPDVPGTYP